MGHFWSFIIPTFYFIFSYNCCVFMHVVIFTNIVFGLGFSCIASEYIFSNHQKHHLMLCCVITTSNFGSIKFCNLCFVLELLLKHWVVEYCYSFWFVFIVFLGNLNPNEACVPKMWKEMFCLWKKKRKKNLQEVSKEKGRPTNNNPISFFFVLLSLNTQQLE
jgi:hypothetical protein